MAMFFPGPWFYVKDHRCKFVVNAGPGVDDKHVALASCDFPDGVGEAIARLIAEAPALLTGLRKAVELLEEAPVDYGVDLVIMKDIILRAEGVITSS